MRKLTLFIFETAETKKILVLFYLGTESDKIQE